MNYNNYSKQELIERIKTLERLNHELLDEKEKETKLDYAWTGNLGHWYWDVKSNDVSFSPLKITALGYKKEEIPEKVNYQFFTDKLHPDDYEKTMEIMYNHLIGKTNVYEVEYRIKTKDGSYKWYYDRGKITQYDEFGKPSFLAGIVFDITDKKELQEELKYENEILNELSYTDELTRIGNRRGINEYLEYYISQAIRKNKVLSIAIFDIDDFKKINDSKGHVNGDKVLVTVVNIIKKCIRNTDFLGRYGGEEFMVVFPDTDITKASMISEEIRQKVQATSFFNDLPVTISGGVKQYGKEDIWEFIDLADTNLYKAKRKGKNQIVAR